MYFLYMHLNLSSWCVKTQEGMEDAPQQRSGSLRVFQRNTRVKFCQRCHSHGVLQLVTEFFQNT